MSLMLSFVALSAFSFTTNDVLGSRNKKAVVVNDCSDVSKVIEISVVKITPGGINWSFVGEYDNENNYITIYNTGNGRRTCVASGTPSVNYNKKGNRKKYNATLNDTYYFNI